MKALCGEETYEYLGMEQRRMTEQEIIKQRLRREFHSRLQGLCKSRLDSGKLIKAINSYAISVLIYSFGIVQWNDKE